MLITRTWCKFILVIQKIRVGRSNQVPCNNERNWLFDFHHQQMIRNVKVSKSSYYSRLFRLIYVSLISQGFVSSLKTPQARTLNLLIWLNKSGLPTQISFGINQNISVRVLSLQCVSIMFWFIMPYDLEDSLDHLSCVTRTKIWQNIKVIGARTGQTLPPWSLLC